MFQAYDFLQDLFCSLSGQPHLADHMFYELYEMKDDFSV